MNRCSLVVAMAAASTAVHAQTAPDWQTAAGGRMAFEVASVKPANGPVMSSNVMLTPWDDNTATGGRFSVDSTLSAFIQFAYKIPPNEAQTSQLTRLPRWASMDRYRIEARASTGNPGKDQMRLMLQSLLAERFHLAAHFESRQTTVLELRLVKPGRPGPRLVPHSEGPPCDKPGRSPDERAPGFPSGCYTLFAAHIPDTSLVIIGSRDVKIDELADGFSGMIPLRLGRPVIDKTGLTGTFDFTLEWAPAATSASALPSAADGPAPVDAIRTQLGLKLQPAKVDLPILVIDHVERPSEN